MKTNKHQYKLLSIMIDLIDSYLDDSTQDFCKVVGKLEGALDASEIKDDDFITQWYNFWTPLEIRRAVEGQQVSRPKAVEELKAMKLFILKNIA